MKKTNLLTPTNPGRQDTGQKPEERLGAQDRADILVQAL